VWGEALFLPMISQAKHFNQKEEETSTTA
jgi:hypothetical protein